MKFVILKSNEISGMKERIKKWKEENGVTTPILVVRQSTEVIVVD